MRKIIVILLLSTTYCFSQILNDTLYLKYDESMRISNSKNSVDDKLDIKLRFTIGSKGNGKSTTYNFLVDNLTTGFKYLNFIEIKNKIDDGHLKNITLNTLEDLSKLSACDLFFLLADTKHLFLIKESNNSYYKYRLMYVSTQRGWEYVRTD